MTVITHEISYKHVASISIDAASGSVSISAGGKWPVVIDADITVNGLTATIDASALADTFYLYLTWVGALVVETEFKSYGTSDGSTKNTYADLLAWRQDGGDIYIKKLTEPSG